MHGHQNLFGVKNQEKLSEVLLLINFNNFKLDLEINFNFTTCLVFHSYKE